MMLPTIYNCSLIFLPKIGDRNGHITSINNEFEIRTSRYFKVAKSEGLAVPTAQAVLCFGFLERKLLKLLDRDLLHMISPATGPFPSSPDSK